MKLQKFSLIDTPHSCSILYFPGCNLDCSYCYNLKLYNNVVEDTDIDLDGAIDYIKSIKQKNPNGETFNTVDYVLFSGGEATRHPIFLKNLCKIVKDEYLKTALYTNGVNTYVVKELLEDGLLDFINVDYKLVTNYGRFMFAIVCLHIYIYRIAIYL